MNRQPITRHNRLARAVALASLPAVAITAMPARKLKSSQVGLPKIKPPTAPEGDAFDLSSHARAREADDHDGHPLQSHGVLITSASAS